VLLPATEEAKYILLRMHTARLGIYWFWETRGTREDMGAKRGGEQQEDEQE
jgi:hypothetical protein